MDIQNAVKALSFVENAADPNYLTFPYTSAIGATTEKLSVRVPFHGTSPSERDEKALAEAVAVQGALGEWLMKDGSAWLMPKT